MKILIFYILIFTSLISFGQNFSEEGWAELDSLNQVAKDENVHDTVRASAYISMAYYYYGINPDTTIQICQNAEFLAERADWTAGKIEVYGWMGYLYNTIGDLEQALNYNDKSMELAREAKDIDAIVTLLNNSAIIYSSWGKTQKALECHVEAMAIHESSGDKVELARSLNSIALILKNQGFLDKALELYEKSLEMRREIGNKSDIGETLNNIGVIYAVQKDYDRAEEYYIESLQLREENGKPSEIANSLNNLGNLYNNREQYDSALVYLFKSLEVRTENGLRRGVCESSIDIGFALHAKGDLIEAKKYSIQGYDMAKKIGDIRLIKNATGTLYKLYLEEGNKAKAFDYYFEHVTMVDSMLNAETQRTTAQMEANYAYEKQKAIDDANHEKQSAIHEEAEKRQRVIIYGVAAGSLLLLGFLIFVFNRLRITRRQKVVIEEQKQEVEEQKSELELTHHALEEKNEEILDSITYAKRIQTAILPPDAMMANYLKDSFVLYLPKDIVAGDFYWLEPKEDCVLFAAADCTGHGVPGAMVSVVCNNALNRSVREYGLTDPGEILDKTREIVVQEFGKSTEDVKDGMDIALCHLQGRKLKYAGAHNPLWIIRNNELIEMKADKQPVGLFEPSTSFTSHEVELEEGDTIYIFSDGYADQFGGSKGKKLKSKGLRELLINIYQLPLAKQKEKLHSHFLEWKGDLEQLDDICLIGVRV